MEDLQRWHPAFYGQEHPIQSLFEKEILTLVQQQLEENGVAQIQIIQARKEVKPVEFIQVIPETLQKGLQESGDQPHQ